MHSLIDQLGIEALMLFKARKTFRGICKSSKGDWDEEINEEIYKEWKEAFEEMNEKPKIYIFTKNK
jgi:Pao retrotransposon peptidase